MKCIKGRSKPILLWNISSIFPVEKKVSFRAFFCVLYAIRGEKEMYLTQSKKYLSACCTVGPGVRVVCGRSPGETVGMNPNGGMDICLL